MSLFIISEIMFFFSFFWSMAHFSLSPNVFLGFVWPPKGLLTLNCWNLPLLNTLILLSSGLTLTLSHRAILFSKRKSALMGLFLTIILGFIFSVFQMWEYLTSSFSINDSIYLRCSNSRVCFIPFFVLKFLTEKIYQ